MAVNLSMLAGAGAQFFDNSGVILSGGLIYTYAAGTTTPQAAYTTISGLTAHANPIVLDSAGRVPSGGEIWLTDAAAYKFVLKTSAAVTIATYDNVAGNASGVLSGIYAAFAASSGASLVGYTQGSPGSVATTVQARLRQYVSVIDFGADPTGATDSTAAIANAIAVGGCIYFPKGVYKCNITLSNVTGIYLLGEAQAQQGVDGARLIPQDNTKPVINLTTNCTSCIVENFVIDSALSSSGASFTHTGIGIQLYARTPNFVWRCVIRHVFIRGFEDGLVIDCDINVSEVFDCDFQDVECLGISRYSFKTRGVYNRFGKLFATQCGISGGTQPTSDFAMYHDGSNCTFDSMVSDGRQYWAGTGNFVANTIIESIYGPGVSTAYPAITLGGTRYNTWQKVRVNGVADSKYQIGVSLQGVQHNVGDIYIEGANYPSTGIQFFTGSSGILGNAGQPSGAAKTSQPQSWYFTGNVSDAISAGPLPLPYYFKDAWDGTEFITPNGSANVILNPTAATLVAGTVIMQQSGIPPDGQKITVSTTKDITTLTFKTTGIYAFWSGATISQALTAGSSRSFIFRYADLKWYPS